MHMFRLELRTMLAVVATLALLLGWARFWGWPGDLVLSVTQFPVAWLSWSAVGFLLGRGSGLTEPRKGRGLLNTSLLMFMGGVTLLVCWARLRSFDLWFTGGRNLCWPDSEIVQFDDWLRNRRSVPHFWKSNCTHSPASVVLGMALSALACMCGLLIGFRCRPSPADWKL